MLWCSSTPGRARTITRHPAALAVSVVAALVLGACGGEAPPDRSLRLDAAADGSLRFERGAVRTTPGRVAVTMGNPSSIPHAVAVRGKGLDESGETVGRDGTSRVAVSLDAGRYVLYCPVGGHERAGMTASLTVR